MLPNLRQFNFMLKPLLAVISNFLFFYSQSALAQTTSVPTTTAPDAATMLSNIAQNIPQLMQMATASAYVLGFYFMYAGVLKMKEYGEQRTMMSSQHSMKGPIVHLCIGAALLYLPSSVASGTSTFWGDPNVYAYVTDSSDQWSDLYQDAFMIIELLGTISFIRGLVILSHLGSQGGQPGTMGKGVTHIIAGVFCINLYAFLNMVNATIGLSPL